MKPRWDLTCIIALGFFVFGYGLGNRSKNASQLTSPTLENSKSKSIETIVDLSKSIPPSINLTQELNVKANLPKTSLKDAKYEFLRILEKQITIQPINPQLEKGEVKKTGQSGIESYTQELLHDGSSAERWYRRDGFLTKENIKMTNGEKVYRAYFENGKVKISSQTLADGTTIYTQFDSTGFITQRTIQKPDGSHYWTEYDDHGNPTQTYWATANGIAELIQ